MKNDILDDPQFHALLLKIDSDVAAKIRAAGCSCGGALHQAHYPRKMQGTFEATPEYSKRHSFCCGRCRQRVTPRSARFLGRRRFPAALVALACDVDKKGMRREHCATLQQIFGVTRRTLLRWKRWWQRTLPQKKFWTFTVQPRFVPALDTLQMPGSMIARFVGEDLRTKLVNFLRFMGPMTIGEHAM